MMQMKKGRLLLILVLLIFTAGCARTAKIRRPMASEVVSKEIVEPKPFFTVGERLTYIVAWKGIPVGRATATVDGMVNYRGYEAYKIVVIAKSNDFLSKLFRIEDIFTSYIDKDKLISRHYEATIREGSYKKDLVVDYDFQKRIAIYRNLRDGSEKTCPIEENVRDPVSAAYFFRVMPINVGDKVKITVNLNEKNYEIFCNVDKIATITLPEIGSFDAFLIKPYVN